MTETQKSILKLPECVLVPSAPVGCFFSSRLQGSNKIVNGKDVTQDFSTTRSMQMSLGQVYEQTLTLEMI